MLAMSEVKTFLIEGEIPFRHTVMKFKKVYRALKKEHALEKLYSELGGNHGVKRFKIRILRVEEHAKET